MAPVLLSGPINGFPGREPIGKPSARLLLLLMMIPSSPKMGGGTTINDDIMANRIKKKLNHHLPINGRVCGARKENQHAKSRTN